MPINAVVADANVLLSAIVGKAALRVFTDFPVAVHATRFNAGEVEEYLPKMSSKYAPPEALVLLQWRLLAVFLHPEDAYVEHLGAARDKLAERDPDDAHPLALAMKLGVPLWSNDRDLHGHNVPAFATARLLRALERT